VVAVVGEVLEKQVIAAVQAEVVAYKVADTLAVRVLQGKAQTARQGTQQVHIKAVVVVVRLLKQGLH
jgi:hypothetical protein